MTIQKTWLTIKFMQGSAYVEASFNYETGKYYLLHGSNDRNVTFGNDGEDIGVAIDRAKCVMAALKFIDKELNG